jgi:putative oxidoreductase
MIPPLQEHLASIVLLLCRVWVAYVFFNAGLTKISTWESTLFLFEYEYQVPLLPWEMAAYLGTAAELILPVFILLGLFTRPMAVALFAFNAIAVISYPLLWEKGYYDHQFWGVMIANLVVWGGGKLSADQWLFKQS